MKQQSNWNITWLMWHGILGGLIFSPGILLGFLYLPPFDHPCHLKSGVPPAHGL